jgi:hypothetical protein
MRGRFYGMDEHDLVTRIRWSSDAALHQAAEAFAGAFADDRDDLHRPAAGSNDEIIRDLIGRKLGF